MPCLRFVDLFAGLGGFHLALARLSHKCVFASEIDGHLGDLYERNFGLKPQGDIRTVPLAQIPQHDILCAGSPCQPFSKAGEQQGLDCPKWGDLLEHVLRIACARRPEYLLLENVPNLKHHNSGDTWRQLEREFERAGYSVSSACLSPHQFGIPQIRERVFIVGSRRGLSHFRWPEPSQDRKLSINAVLDRLPVDSKPLSVPLLACLKVWQQFIKRFPLSSELPWFPIWTAEFGATYPYEDSTPWAMPACELRRYHGAHGESLRKKSPEDLFAALPSYARTQEKQFPAWKRNFIRLNRELYREHMHWIDEWLPRIIPFHSSLQKLEWHCKGEERDIWKYVIQIRASGVRVKRPTTAPSLIAMTTTQIPIIAWERRYMTPRECARLQSLDDLKHLPKVETQAFKALGNAVNAELIRLIAERLLRGRPPRALPVLLSHRESTVGTSVSPNA